MLIAEGNLSDRPLPRTFAAIAARGFTGELVVQGPGKPFHVAWRDGAVVGAQSPHPADGAARIAVTLGVLNSTQAGEVARVLAANPGADEIEVVATVARLSSELIGRLGRRLAATRAARVFSVEQGTFALHATQPAWGNLVPIDPRWIMYSGVRMHYTVERLHREVTGLATAIRLRPDADLSSFGFGEAEADALQRLRGGTLSVMPAPVGLDARVVQAVALVLLAVGDAEPATGSSPSMRAPRRMTQQQTPRSSPALRVPTPPRSRPITQRRPRIADPSKTRAIIAERLAVLDGGADYHTLLGVSADASGEEIRHAYFHLARHLHPDRLSAAGIADDKREAHRLFAKINEAFAVLSDDGRRAQYQELVRQGGAQAVRAQTEAAEARVRQVLAGEEAYRRGELALRRGELDGALVHFRQAVELAPDEPDHHAMLGWATYVQATEKTAAAVTARAHLKKALEKDARSGVAHLMLGRIARMEGQDAESLAHLRQAQEFLPRNPDVAAELRAAEARRTKSGDATRAGGLAGLFGRKKT